MSDTPQELLKGEGALDVLRHYGLYEVVTDQDDPWLWATALLHHWPAPWESDVDITTLCFGIGRPVSEEESVATGRSGMELIEEWCFKRIDAGYLRAVKCSDVPTMSFMAMMVSGNLAPIGESQVSLVRDYLDISRPTYGQKKALVHKGMSVPPNVGTGETRFWERSGDGSWVETEEIYSRWLT